MSSSVFLDIVAKGPDSHIFITTSSVIYVTRYIEIEMGRLVQSHLHSPLLLLPISSHRTVLLSVEVGVGIGNCCARISILYCATGIEVSRVAKAQLLYSHDKALVHL